MEKSEISLIIVSSNESGTDALPLARPYFLKPNSVNDITRSSSIQVVLSYLPKNYTPIY